MEAMQSHGLKGKYKVLPNVIQTQIFKPFSPPALSLRPEFIEGGVEGSTFIHVSTFDPRQKNTLGILRAFKKALEKKPELNLVLVGGEEHQSELREYIKQNALQNKVQFKGKSKAEELAVLFNQSKALILFSNYESFGVVIGEALACGLPVICSQAGGLANSLGPELGLKVPSKNEDQLCAAILNMAENKVVYNTTTLRNFVTERFSEAVIAEELKTLYQEILNQK
jgi:L-malate glycosyltransferase